MFMMFIYLFIMFIVIIKFINTVREKSLPNQQKLMMNFSNVQKLFTTSTMTIYKGDRSGENFLLAIKFPYKPISKLDLSTIYDIAEKNHLHNKILISNENVSSNPNLNKELKKYDIRIVNSLDFQKNMGSSNSSSILTTSDTSDDHCNIDEPNNPIKYINSDSKGIFSIFRNKPDRL